MIVSTVLPIALQQVLVSLSFILGNFILAQSGSIDIAAIGSANRFLFILRFALIAFAIGNAILSAQFAKTSKGDVGKIFTISVIASIAFSIIFIVFYFVNRDIILESFSKNILVRYTAGQYIDIAIYSSIALSITLSLLSTFRSLGMLWTTLTASVIGIISNAGLNYLLIKGYFGSKSLVEMMDLTNVIDIKSVAKATIASDVIVALFLIAVCLVKRNALKKGEFNLGMFSVDSKLTWKYLKVSLIILASHFVWSLHTMIMHNLFGKLGTHELTAYGAVMPIEIITYDVFSAFGFAALLMVGEHLAKDKNDKAYATADRLLKLGLILGSICGVVMFAFSGQISKFYSVSVLERDRIAYLLKILGISLPLKMVSNMLYNGILRSGGDATFLLGLTILLAWGIIIPVSYWGYTYMGFGLYNIYLVIHGAELVTVACMYIRFRSKSWMKNLTK